MRRCQDGAFDPDQNFVEKVVLRFLTYLKKLISILAYIVDLMDVDLFNLVLIF